MQEEIKHLIEEINPYAEFNEETKLLEEGILDSLEIFAFVTQLEDVYNIEVPDEAITAEHFETVGSIVSFIQELLRNEKRAE